MADLFKLSQVSQERYEYIQLQFFFRDHPDC